MSVWLKRCSALVAGTTAMVLAAGPAVAADEVGGAEKRPRGEVTAAQQFVLVPDLGITHRLASGGMNLWRMPLSDLEQPATGKPELVKKLDFGGFSYDRSKTVAGDFADVTPSDDGTADHIIWHGQPDGSVLVWGVGGGSGETAPKLWASLRTGGWSYADSTPMAGDMNGDGWDDLVVAHRAGRSWNLWVFPSDGTKLGEPHLAIGHWESHLGTYDSTRIVLGSTTGYGTDVVAISAKPGGGLEVVVHRNESTPNHWFFEAQGVTARVSGGGWSYPRSRQLLGDVTGDGHADLISVHAQGGNSTGMLVWVHPYVHGDGVPPTFGAPTVWQDLKTGGWSFADSRQHLADTNGDFVDDLISVHAQGANPGELVWRHVSTGVGLRAPQVLADLKTGGWNYKASRESVANLLGVMF